MADFLRPGMRNLRREEEDRQLAIDDPLANVDLEGKSTEELLRLRDNLALGTPFQFNTPASPSQSPSLEDLSTEDLLKVKQFQEANQNRWDLTADEISGILGKSPGAPLLEKSPSGFDQWLRGKTDWSPADLGRTIGGVVGSAGALATPIKSSALGTALGGVGEAVGEDISTAYDRLSPSRLAPRPQAPEQSPKDWKPLVTSPSEAAGNVAMGAAKEGTAQLLTTLLPAGVRKVTGGMFSKGMQGLDLNAPLATQQKQQHLEHVRNLGKKHDIDLGVAEQSGSLPAAKIQGYLEKSMFGGQEAIENSERVNRQFRDALQRNANQAGGGQTLPVGEAGQNLLESVVNRTKASSAKFKQEYDEIGEGAEGMMVEPEAFNRLQQELRKTVNPRGGGVHPALKDIDSIRYGDPNVIPLNLSPQERSAIERAAKSGNPGAIQTLEQLETQEMPATFDSLRQRRTYFGNKIKEAKKAGDSEGVMWYSRALSATDEDIAGLINATGDDTLLLKYANTGERYRKEHAEVFKNRDVQQLLKVDPSKAIDHVIQVGGSTEKLAKLEKAAGPQAWAKMRGAWLQDKVEQMADTKTGQPTLDKFLTQFASAKNEDPYLEKLLGPGSMQTIKELRTIGEHIKKMGATSTNPSGTAQSLLAAQGLRESIGLISLGLNHPLAAIGGAVGYKLGQKAGSKLPGEMASGVGAAVGGVGGATVGYIADKQAGIDQQAGKEAVLTSLGTIALTTKGLSRLLYTEQGRKFLLQGLKAEDVVGKGSVGKWQQLTKDEPYTTLGKLVKHSPNVFLRDRIMALANTPTEAESNESNPKRLTDLMPLTP